MLALVSIPGAVVVLVTVIHIIVCIFLIGVVLLQRGRSQDLASAFGGGQTQANMAAMSTDDFLTRATKIAAVAFMVTSMGLALSTQKRATSVLDVVPDTNAPAAASGPTGASGETTPAPTGASAPETSAPSIAPVEIQPVPAPTEPPPPAPTEPAPAETTPPPATGPTGQ